jgi:hypothetical protein
MLSDPTGRKTMQGGFRRVVVWLGILVFLIGGAGYAWTFTRHILSDRKRHSSLSFKSDRQIKSVSFIKFEKSEALVTLEKLVRKKPNSHSVDLRPFAYVCPTEFSSLVTSATFLGKQCIGLS